MWVLDIPNKSPLGIPLVKRPKVFYLIQYSNTNLLNAIICKIGLQQKRFSPECEVQFDSTIPQF